MAKILSFSDYPRQQREARVQDALSVFYFGALQVLSDERERIRPRDLEAFLIAAVADHLMADFLGESIEEADQLAHDFSSFQTALLQAINERLERLGLPASPED